MKSVFWKLFSLKRKLKRGEELFYLWGVHDGFTLRVMKIIYVQTAIFAQASDFVGHDWFKVESNIFCRLLIFDRGVA